jgi:GNAT superfamily N-acetyltransferase
MIEVIKLEPNDIDRLMRWRMETLRAVFALPASQDLSSLEQENRAYYERELPAGGHSACMALVDGEEAGCGGVCFQREMPSPDNPTGMCAYLMNVYTRPCFRHHGVGRAVVDWLVEQAQLAGAEKIYLETTEEGRSLYVRSGFVDMEGMMCLPLGKS